MWEITNERRASPRRRTNVEFRVLLVARKTNADGDEQTLPLIGYTHDISESGIALVISSKTASVLSTLGDSYTLQLVLTIPGGSIELETTPARYQPLNGGDSAARTLIGARITGISSDDRARLEEYLRSLA
jgi:hypothetical protein